MTQPTERLRARAEVQKFLHSVLLFYLPICNVMQYCFCRFAISKLTLMKEVSFYDSMALLEADTRRNSLAPAQ
jgi:hypothetical protein